MSRAPNPSAASKSKCEDTSNRRLNALHPLLVLQTLAHSQKAAFLRKDLGTEALCQAERGCYQSDLQRADF